MITLLYHILWTPCICKKTHFVQTPKKADWHNYINLHWQKNTTSYYTNVDSMSTNTLNEIKHLIEQLNQISAQCEQNDYSTKNQMQFSSSASISDELPFLLMIKQQQ